MSFLFIIHTLRIWTTLSIDHCKAVRQVTYVGDGNNIVHSWIRLAAKFDFEFVCACPEGFEPDAATVQLANAAGAGRVSVSHDPFEVSMSQGAC